MFKDAIELGYQPPTNLKSWSERGITSRFEERDDITWMKKDVLKEYIKIYNGEFGEYKHAYQKEAEGEYVNPMNEKADKPIIIQSDKPALDKDEWDIGIKVS